MKFVEIQNIDLNKEPLHVRIKQIIRVYINDNQPEFLPSERVFQQKMNVSRTTVRKALGELEQERRIMAVHGKGYRVLYRKAGGELKGYIGVAINTGMPEYEHEVFNRIIDHIYKSGFSPLVTVINPQYELVAEKLAVLLSNVDGVILASSFFARLEVAAGMKDYFNKLVAVPYRLRNDIGIPAVYAEMEKSYEKLAGHLLRRGHRQIAVLVNSGDKSRISGIENAFRKLNIEPDRGLYLDTHGYRHCGYEQFGKLLAKRKPFTAVICQNDPCALGVMERCFKEGISVPDEVSIAGFDNVEKSELYPVPLTTAGIDLAKMARCALELLLEGIRTGNPAQAVAIDSKLIIRDSVKKLKIEN